MKSFSSQVKDEVLASVPSSQCCRRALLMGLMINAECGVGDAVYLRITGKELAPLVQKLLFEQFGREVTPDVTNCYGRSVAEFGFVSSKLAAALTELSDAQKTEQTLPFLKCKACASAFCAGLLLSAARISDPAKESRLEFRISDPQRAMRTAAFFTSRGNTPSISGRTELTSLLFRRTEDVEDVLAIGGASVSAMASMQQKLVRELRGEVNRKSNCEVKNIRRATSAATLQLEAIKKLRASGKFDLLSDELKETAILREEEPEMPLSELAQRHIPPISKSGLNHRMEKLLSAAEKI